MTGGGRQWKSIITDNDTNPNIIKLKHDYLDFFVFNDYPKFPLNILAIWLVRFNQFDSELPVSKIINNFCEYFCLLPEEKLYFFSNNNEINLTYETTPVEPVYIRSLINTTDKAIPAIWSLNEVDSIKSASLSGIYPEIFKPMTINFEKFANKSVEEYYELLNRVHQCIFMGAPGTSKSYMANRISEKFNNVLRLQFHPQYTYQEFINGKVLEDGNVRDKKGTFIKFLDKALEKSDEEFLLIIEEFNRANVSQVFGELIQLLDRGESLSLIFNNETKVYSLPPNLKIIGTMNTTDRTLGRIDYALKRRFYQIKFGVDYDFLIDYVSIEDNKFSVSDFLHHINNSLVSYSNNKETLIGHALFLKDFVYDESQGKYVWSIQDFSNLFNYVLLPIIEDYCNGNTAYIEGVLGDKLPMQLDSKDFAEAAVELIIK